MEPKIKIVFDQLNVLAVTQRLKAAHFPQQLCGTPKQAAEKG
jgi:hypothetical protein